MIFVANLVDWFPAAFPGKQAIGCIENESRFFAAISIPMDDAGWNENDNWIGTSHTQRQPVPVGCRRGACVPGKQLQIPWAKTGKQVGLVTVFVRPTGHSGQCLTGVGHGGFQSSGQLIASEDFHKPSTRIFVPNQRSDKEALDRTIFEERMHWKLSR